MGCFHAYPLIGLFCKGQRPVSLALNYATGSWVLCPGNEWIF